MGLALMAYFYCDFMDSKKQDVCRLLASLIAQLSAKSDACYNILYALYDRYNEGFRQPDEDILLGCLEKMLKTEGQPTMYIFIDALEEYPNDSGVKSPQEQVLELVINLVDLHLPNVRICVTSCPEMDIFFFFFFFFFFEINLLSRVQRRDILSTNTCYEPHSETEEVSHQQ
jgi:hypothetical protein